MQNDNNNNNIYSTIQMMQKPLYVLSSKFEELGTAIIQSEAIQAFRKMAEQIKSIQIPKLSETIEIIRFFDTLEKIEWPLYLVFDNKLMQILGKYNNLTKANTDEIKNIIYHYCNYEFVGKRLCNWKNSSVIDKARLPILDEAISLYKAKFYYGCVSILVCQLFGIINDTYNMQKSYGKEFNLEDFKYIYEYYNPDNSFTKNRIKKGGEKNQLLSFTLNVEGGGILCWIKAIEYIYKIILTSNNHRNQSNHPCRNKICHGIQTNYGTKEHSLKAILSIDMMIYLAENLKQTNDEIHMKS